MISPGTHQQLMNHNRTAQECDFYSIHFSNSSHLVIQSNLKSIWPLHMSSEAHVVSAHDLYQLDLYTDGT